MRPDIRGTNSQPSASIPWRQALKQILLVMEVNMEVHKFRYPLFVRR